MKICASRTLLELFAGGTLAAVAAGQHHERGTKCRACSMRQARASAGARWQARWDVWLPAEDRRLAELAPYRDLDQIATELAAEFGVSRSTQAVRRRASTLRIRLPRRFLTLADLERMFGVDGGTILRRWVAAGALSTDRRNERGRSPQWHFRETEIEAFIRAHPWLYDWTRMRPGHRLRSLAEVVHLSDPWLTLAEASKRSPFSVKQLRRAVARGGIPHERRWHGCGPWGQIVIRAADLDCART